MPTRLAMPLLLLTLFLLPANGLFAQKALSNVPKTWEQEIVSIDFPGGKLGDLIRGLKDSYAELGKYDNVGIVVTEDAANYQLPPINIKSNFFGIESLLSLLGDSNSSIVIEEADSKTGVYAVRIDRSEEPEVHVINTKQLLEIVPESSLLSAIEIGMAMQNLSQKQVQLKLHQETGLMFVRGTSIETRLVDDIVDQLHAASGIGRNSGRGNQPGGGMMGGMGGGDMGGGFDGGGSGMGGGFGGGGTGGPPKRAGGKFGGMGGRGLGGGLGSGIGQPPGARGGFGADPKKGDQPESKKKGR